MNAERKRKKIEPRERMFSFFVYFQREVVVHKKWLNEFLTRKTTAIPMKCAFAILFYFHLLFIFHHHNLLLFLSLFYRWNGFCESILMYNMLLNHKSEEININFNRFVIAISVFIHYAQNDKCAVCIRFHHFEYCTTQKKKKNINNHTNNNCQLKEMVFNLFAINLHYSLFFIIFFKFLSLNIL